MNKMKKKCICDEMAKKLDILSAMSFKCPVHGAVTIDKRNVLPTLFPVPQPSPAWPFCPPYPGQPYPGGPNFSGGRTDGWEPGRVFIGGAVQYQERGKAVRNRENQ